jgi:hypothetical protein
VIGALITRMLSTVVTMSHLSLTSQLKVTSVEGAREMLLFLLREDGEKMGWGNRCPIPYNLYRRKRKSDRGS